MTDTTADAVAQLGARSTVREAVDQTLADELAAQTEATRASLQEKLDRLGTPTRTQTSPPRALDGPSLRAAREAKGFRQSQVADAIGMKRPFLNRLESGKTTTTNAKWPEKLSVVLDVPLEQITRPVDVRRPPAPESVEVIVRRMFGAPDATVEQIIADYLVGWDFRYAVEALVARSEADGVITVPVALLREMLDDDHADER